VLLFEATQRAEFFLFLSIRNDVGEMDQQLLRGAAQGDLDLMREALRNGADVNTREIYNATPFINACMFGRLEAVRFLSTVPGINLNAVNNSGESAFHYVCMLLRQHLWRSFQSGSLTFGSISSFFQSWV